MKSTLPPKIPLRNTLDLREEIILCARGGADLAEIDRVLIESAAIDEDEQAALWLLAWCSRPEERGPCRR